MRALTVLAALSFAAAVAAPAAADEPKPPKEKRICRSVPGTTNIMPTSVCRPASQWEQIDQQRKPRFSQKKDDPAAETTKKGD